MEEEILISGSAVLNILPALLVGIGIGILWGSSKTFSLIKAEFIEKKENITSTGEDREEVLKKLDFGINMLITSYEAQEKTGKIASRCFLGAFAVILVVGFSL